MPSFSPVLSTPRVVSFEGVELDERSRRHKPLRQSPQVRRRAKVSGFWLSAWGFKLSVASVNDPLFYQPVLQSIHTTCPDAPAFVRCNHSRDTAGAVIGLVVLLGLEVRAVRVEVEAFVLRFGALGFGLTV